MTTLGGWMNKTLIGWGVDPKFANTFDETSSVQSRKCLPLMKLSSPY